MDRIELRNRVRCGMKYVKGSEWYVAVAAFVYGFIHEPREWKKHCEYMQKRLDYARVQGHRASA